MILEKKKSPEVSSFILEYVPEGKKAVWYHPQTPHIKKKT